MMTSLLEKIVCARYLCGLMITITAYANPVLADVVQINAAIANGHFVRGQNLTNDQAAIFLGVDWSSDEGAFAGAECYTSNANRPGALPHGCQYYLGYFRPLKNDQALSLSVTHNDYVRTRSPQWDFTQASLDWHLNTNATLNLTATDDWLGRGFATASLNGILHRPISKRLSAKLSAGIMKVGSRAPVDNIELVELGLQYQMNRWTAGVSASFTDRDDLRQITQFEVDQPEVNFSLRFRLY